MKAAAALLALGLAGCATSGPVFDANGNAAVARARELRMQGRDGEAEATIAEAMLRGEGNTAEMQGALARAVVFRDPHRALDLIDQAIDPANPNPNLLNVQGVALDLIGDHAAARAAYLHALKIAPDFQSAKNNLAISRTMTTDATKLAGLR